jgi:hypothetical protein
MSAEKARKGFLATESPSERLLLVVAKELKAACLL